MKRRIMIVDDEPRITQAFTELFRQDYAVHSANDGETAISFIEEFRPELIVLDWRLRGEVEGKDVLKFSKREFPEIPVYVVTASIHFLEEIKSSGADECLLKPCPDLRERILAALPPHQPT